MKRVEATVGYKIYDGNNNLIGFEPDTYGEGRFYKDDEAFRDNPDAPCYIPEFAFEDTGFVSIEDESIETRNTIREQIKYEFAEDYCLTDEQVDYFTFNLYEIAEWAYIETYISENFLIEDCIDEGTNTGNEKSIFDEFQVDAVRSEMTPKEYCQNRIKKCEKEIEKWKKLLER